MEAENLPQLRVFDHQHIVCPDIEPTCVSFHGVTEGTGIFFVALKGGIIRAYSCGVHQPQSLFEYRTRYAEEGYDVIDICFLPSVMSIVTREHRARSRSAKVSEDSVVVMYQLHGFGSVLEPLASASSHEWAEKLRMKSLEERTHTLSDSSQWHVQAHTMRSPFGSRITACGACAVSNLVVTGGVDGFVAVWSCNSDSEPPQPVVFLNAYETTPIVKVDIFGLCMTFATESGRVRSVRLCFEEAVERRINADNREPMVAVDDPHNLARIPCEFQREHVVHANRNADAFEQAYASFLPDISRWPLESPEHSDVHVESEGRDRSSTVTQLAASASPPLWERFGPVPALGMQVRCACFPHIRLKAAVLDVDCVFPAHASPSSPRKRRRSMPMIAAIRALQYVPSSAGRVVMQTAMAEIRSDQPEGLEGAERLLMELSPSLSRGQVPSTTTERSHYQGLQMLVSSAWEGRLYDIDAHRLRARYKYKAEAMSAGAGALFSYAVTRSGLEVWALRAPIDDDKEMAQTLDANLSTRPGADILGDDDDDVYQRSWLLGLHPFAGLRSVAVSSTDNTVLLMAKLTATDALSAANMSALYTASDLISGASQSAESSRSVSPTLSGRRSRDDIIGWNLYILYPEALPVLFESIVEKAKAVERMNPTMSRLLLREGHHILTAAIDHRRGVRPPISGLSRIADLAAGDAPATEVADELESNNLLFLTKRAAAIVGDSYVALGGVLQGDSETRPGRIRVAERERDVSSPATHAYVRAAYYFAHSHRTMNECLAALQPCVRAVLAYVDQVLLLPSAPEFISTHFGTEDSVAHLWRSNAAAPSGESGDSGAEVSTELVDRVLQLYRQHAPYRLSPLILRLEACSRSLSSMKLSPHSVLYDRSVAVRLLSDYGAELSRIYDVDNVSMNGQVVVQQSGESAGGERLRLDYWSELRPMDTFCLGLLHAIAGEKEKSLRTFDAMEAHCITEFILDAGNGLLTVHLPRTFTMPDTDDDVTGLSLLHLDPRGLLATRDADPSTRAMHLTTLGEAFDRLLITSYPVVYIDVLSQVVNHCFLQGKVVQGVRFVGTAAEVLRWHCGDSVPFERLAVVWTLTDILLAVILNSTRHAIESLVTGGSDPVALRDIYFCALKLYFQRLLFHVNSDETVQTYERKPDDEVQTFFVKCRRLREFSRFQMIMAPFTLNRANTISTCVPWMAKLLRSARDPILREIFELLQPRPREFDVPSQESAMDTFLQVYCKSVETDSGELWGQPLYDPRRRSSVYVSILAGLLFHDVQFNSNVSVGNLSHLPWDVLGAICRNFERPEANDVAVAHNAVDLTVEDVLQMLVLPKMSLRDALALVIHRCTGMALEYAKTVLRTEEEWSIFLDEIQAALQRVNSAPRRPRASFHRKAVSAETDISFGRSLGDVPSTHLETEIDHNADDPYAVLLSKLYSATMAYVAQSLEPSVVRSCLSMKLPFKAVAPYTLHACNRSAIAVVQDRIHELFDDVDE